VRNRIKALPEGPVVVASNHLSWIDIPLLGVTVPRRIAFMGKVEYFRSRFHRFILWTFDGFPVERGKVDRTALARAEEAVRNGCALGIFPEGTRSRTFQLQKGHLGTAFIALRNDAFILPVGISGTEKIRHRYQNRQQLLYRPDVLVNIGEPFKLPRVEGSPNRKELQSSTETIMLRVAALLPEDYRGVYRDILATEQDGTRLCESK
ncbi:MAG: lysophospholipid acyltransferase family protein, partial [Chloroflexi bacterium]|nr:lysophospholipid acyltransferase family protein [Chloroflexota bacterium]